MVSDSQSADVRAAGSTGPSRGERRTLVLRILALVVSGVSLYAVGPGLIALFGDIPKLGSVFPLWFVPIFLLEGLAFASTWVLMGSALQSTQWFDIACAQLTGNALSRALPGGAATG